MTVVGRKFEELKALLVAQGYEIVCGDFFDEYNRIICKKGDHTFVLQYSTFYNYRFIVKLFTDLGLTVPDDCQHVYQQEQDLINKTNKKERGE